MNLLDEIKKSNIIPPDNDISLEEAILRKISKKLDISFVLKKAIPLNVYNSLKSKTLEVVSNLGLEVNIKIGYQDEELSVDELKEYLSEILNILTQASARFKALNINDAQIEGNNITFLVAYDALGLENLCLPIKNEFAKYGLEINIFIEEDESKSVQAQIAALDNQIQNELNKQNEEAKAAQNFNKKMNQEKKKYTKEVIKNVSSIKEIPTTYEGIQEYQYTIRHLLQSLCQLLHQ